jgi:hypothetical protein
MRSPCYLACVLCVLLTAFLASGCTSTASMPAPRRLVQTYAIVAADDQGILSQTELNSIVDTLVQFLLDQGYVRSDQVFIDDPGQAAVVFRMRIAWNTGRTSFAVVSVAPSSGGPVVYADAAPVAAPTAYPPDEDWDDDPWRYDDDVGYAYGPYCPFFTIFPFIPFYGFDHHHRPPLVHRPPQHRRPSEHRLPTWRQYRQYVTPSQVGSASRIPLLLPQRPRRSSGLAGSSPAWSRTHPAPAHQTQPATSTSGRPADRDVRPPISDAHRTSPSRPPVNDRAQPQDVSTSRPPIRESNRHQAAGSSQYPASPAGHDPSASANRSMAPTRPAPGPDHHPAPDSFPHPASSNVRPPSATIPPREPAPSRQDYSPAPSHSSAPSPSPPAPSASSSSSKTDSKSQSRDR